MTIEQIIKLYIQDFHEKRYFKLSVDNLNDLMVELNISDRKNITSGQGKRIRALLENQTLTLNNTSQEYHLIKDKYRFNKVPLLIKGDGRCFTLSSHDTAILSCYLTMDNHNRQPLLRPCDLTELLLELHRGSHIRWYPKEVFQLIRSNYHKSHPYEN